MLTLVAYDISDQKRLARVARVCEDSASASNTASSSAGCEEAEFTEFWLRLLEEIDEEEDRIVAYKIDARCAKETLTAGRMVCSEKVRLLPRMKRRRDRQPTLPRQDRLPT